MSEQEENELICEKLLGWTRAEQIRGRTHWNQSGKYALFTLPAPAFTDWASAGLILDAFAAQWPISKAALRGLGGSMCLGGITPAEIRESALEYVREAP